MGSVMKMVAQSDEKYNGFLMQNKVEIVFSVWYSKCKERHLHEQMPFAEPHSKGGASRGGTYLSVRGAHPGLNRVGIIFLSFYPYRKYE
ncbi:MAG: hypothetical protein K1W27_13370 [Lachnospiraceae bacterium]